MDFRFSAAIRKAGVNPYVDLPESADTSLSTAGYVAIVGTIDGHPFRSGLVPLGGGRHRLFVNGRMRKIAGVDVGDVVEVAFARDAEPRRRAVPEPLSEALASDAQAGAAWDALRASRRNEILDYLNALKHSESLHRNVDKVVASLRTPC